MLAVFFPQLQDALTPVSPNASRIEHLWWWLFGVCLAGYALTIIVLSIGATRRRAPGPVPPLPSDPLLEQALTRRVSVITGLTFGILVALLVASVIVEARTMQHPPHGSQVVTVEVVGHQWWWEVRYPNDQADLTVTTANEIHVPTHTPIIIKTNSRDVIHSFWAPNIDGKRDLMPGYQTSFWTQIDKEGRYRGQCAEYCGHQHAHMAFYIVAEPAEQFQQWLDGQRKSAIEPNTETQIRGQHVFLGGTCMMCHTIRGTEAGSRVGPDLTHLASRQTIAAGTLANNRGSLGGWIMDPQGIKPGARMPKHSLSGDDLNALLEYLGSLK